MTMERSGLDNGLSRPKEQQVTKSRHNPTLNQQHEGQENPLPDFEFPARRGG